MLGALEKFRSRKLPEAIQVEKRRRDFVLIYSFISLT